MLWNIIREGAWCNCIYDFVDWRVLVMQLAERMRLAEILGEPQAGCVTVLKRQLMIRGKNTKAKGKILVDTENKKPELAVNRTDHYVCKVE